MNVDYDTAVIMLAITFPVVMTFLLVSGELELWAYLGIYGICLWGLGALKKE
ncbi:MAG: hypothetical protein RIE73_16215 [Coleofasciculus sp. C1-SOL-03]|jgi:hypothetical protein|uniref:hypothetical protein n=1 Tax=Coleofasciculus sp. C1-SOL-03 TaxID=3069522 RepID=UPI0032F5B096